MSLLCQFISYNESLWMVWNELQCRNQNCISFQLVGQSIFFNFENPILKMNENSFGKKL
jgi:hypothetical protein